MPPPAWLWVCANPQAEDADSKGNGAAGKVVAAEAEAARRKREIDMQKAQIEQALAASEDLPGAVQVLKTATARQP